MAYSATKNGEVFFSTDSMDQSLALASAQLELKAGAAGLFSFTVLPNNRFYDEFSLVSDYIDVYRNQKLIFSGRVSSISQAFDLSLKIEAQGLLSILNDTIYRPDIHTGTVRQLLTKLINSHNDQVEAAKQITIGNVQISDDPCYRAYENYESTFSRLSDLVDSFGGYLYIRKESGGLYLDWKEITVQGAQTVNFGENLIDITRGSDSENYITVLIPLGAQIEDTTTGARSRVTIESVNQGLDYIVKSGTTNKIVGTYTWDDVTEPSNLLRKAQTYLNEQAMLYTTIDVTTIDLADAGYDIDNFEIGKVIAVTSYPHGLENDTFECLSQSLNLLSPDDNKLSLGGVVEGFTIRARKEAKLNTQIIEKIEANYTTNQRLNELKNLLDQSIQENYTLIEQNSEHIVLLAEQVANASKIFYDVPVPPYSRGDLWYRGTTDDTKSAIPGIAIPGVAIPGVGGDLYICNNDRGAGEDFNYSDWSPTYKGQLEGINKRITSAKIEIDGANGRIDLLSQDADYLRGRISTAEIKIDAVDSRIDLASSRIDNLTGDLRSAEIRIDGADASISLVATDVNKLQGRMTTAELNIDAANSEIALKVSNSDYTAATIVAKINGSESTVKVQADHIKLEGLTTINDYFKILSDGSMVATNGTFTGSINASSGVIGGFTISNTENHGTTAKGGHYYTNSLYAHYTIDDYDYEAGLTTDTDNSTYVVNRYPEQKHIVFYVRKNYHYTNWTSGANPTFYVNCEGLLYAEHSKIGGFETDTGSFHTDGVDVTSNAANSIGFSASGFTRTITIGRSDVSDSLSLHLAIGSALGITHGGVIYAAGIVSNGVHVVGGGTFVQTYASSNTRRMYLLNDNYVIRYEQKVDGYWQTYFYVQTSGQVNCYADVVVSNDVYCNKVYEHSDERLKTDIVALSLEESASFIYSVTPYKFRFKKSTDKQHHGFLAGDVKQRLSDDWAIVQPSNDDEKNIDPANPYLNLSYTEFIADIIATLQLQHQEIEELKRTLKIKGG